MRGKKAVRNTSFSLPRTRATLAQGLASIFADLGLSAALRDGSSWFPIHRVRSVHDVEIAHGVEERRYAYNERCFAKLGRQREQLLVGRHAGFFDLFARVGDASGNWGALVTGPFAIARPSASDIQSRWRAMSGGLGRVSDPDFRHYVATSLGTTTFDGDDFRIFQRCVACFAMLLEGSADAERLASESAALREKLWHVRLSERMWDVSRSLVDDHPHGGFNHWRAREHDSIEMGVTRQPTDVVVGLMLGSEGQVDPVDDLVRRDSFQRALVDVATSRGGLLCGRIGDHGVALLVDAGVSARQKARVADVGERVRSVARRFGLTLHLGVSARDPDASLPARYQSALAAAETALARGSPLVQGEGGRRPTRTMLSELRRELSLAVGESPNMLSPRFDRYLEAVAIGCGYQLDPFRARLEAGFDALTDSLRSARAIDEKSLVDLEDRLDKGAAYASTVRELADSYRGIVKDIERAIQIPRVASRDRSVRRAVAYIRDHFTETLRLGRVARVAGLAPGYFSKLFARSEKVTFQEYVTRLRIERAKHMLTATELTAEQVGRLVGFASRSRFHVVFQHSTGMPPLAFRRRNPPASVHLPLPKSRLR
jgi:AraC-like DNA-binding protein